MPSHRPPAPTRPSRLWLCLMAAAVTGIVAGTVAAGHASAPKVAADERLALTPERSPEPVAHGGPLVLPSIGAVVSDPVAYLPPVERPAVRRSVAPVPTRRVTATPQTTPEAVSGDLAAITGTSQPTVTPPSQTVAAATAEPTVTTDPTGTPSCLPLPCPTVTTETTTTTETPETTTTEATTEVAP